MACEYCKTDRYFIKQYKWTEHHQLQGTDCIEIDCNVGGKMIVYTENMGRKIQAEFKINYCPNCGQKIIGQYKKLPRLNTEIEGLIAWINSGGTLVSGGDLPSTIEGILYEKLIYKIKTLLNTERDITEMFSDLTESSLLLRELIEEKYPEQYEEYIGELMKSPEDIFEVAALISKEESE